MVGQRNRKRKMKRMSEAERERERNIENEKFKQRKATKQQIKKNGSICPFFSTGLKGTNRFRRKA